MLTIIPKLELIPVLPAWPIALTQGWLTLCLLVLTTSTLLLSPALEAEESIQPQATSVDINTASAEEIAQALNGIGQRKAQAIVDFREQGGPFRSVDELTEVRGIGPSILARNKARIRLCPPQPR